MASQKHQKTEMHTLYLSDSAWGELKRCAVMEGSDASKITDQVLRVFLEQMPGVELPHRRSRAETLERLNRRNLHLQKDTWERVVKDAQEKKYSISVLIEFLLRNYLGLEITEDIKPRQKE